MKLSNPRFALILIASALLLSGAKSSPQGANLNLRRVGQSNQGTNANKEEPGQTGLPNIATTQTNLHTEPNNTKQQSIEVSIRKDWSDYGLLYVTVLVALITFFQYRIARLAYLVDRPYLIVGQTTLLNFTTFERMTTGLALTTASITIENVGKRPAMVNEVKGQLLLLPDASGGGIPFPPADWGNLESLQHGAPQRKVIPEHGSIEVLVQYPRGLVSEEDYRAIKMTYTKILVAAGAIKYRPVAGWWQRLRPYKTTFGLRYNPPGFLGENDFFNVGPDRYNKNT